MTWIQSKQQALMSLGEGWDARTTTQLVCFEFKYHYQALHGSTMVETTQCLEAFRNIAAILPPQPLHNPNNI